MIELYYEKRPTATRWGEDSSLRVQAQKLKQRKNKLPLDEQTKNQEENLLT